MVYFLIILFLLIGGIYFFIQSGIQLPKNVDTLIEEVRQEPISEFISGKTGKAKNGEITIFYEAIKGTNSPKGTILLINGHTQTLLDWYPSFYQPLVNEGYQVVRFDNRGLGESDWLADWGKPKKYKLEDMALDALAVLDDLKVEKAHLIGMSMGGMIGQRLAISHAQRVLSLTSIMSTGYYFDPSLVNVPRPFYQNIIRLSCRYLPTIKKEDSQLKYHLGIQRMLKGKGDYPFDDKMILQKAFYEIHRRKGFNYKTADQHSYAIKASGSRYEELANINIPVLVIHGTTDPLINFPHASKYADMIPNAQTLFIEGMGHDIPAFHTPTMMKAIFNNLAT